MRFCIGLILLLGGLGAKASTSVTSLESDAKSSLWGGSVGASVTGNMQPLGSTEKSTQTSTSFTLSRKLLNSTVSLSTGTTYSSKSSENVEMSNTTLGVSFPSIELNKNLSLSNSSVGIAPTNESNRKYTRMKGALGHTSALVYKGYSLSLGVTRFFHEFTQSADREPNVAFQVVNGLGKSFELVKNLKLSLSAKYTTAITHSNQKRNGFGLSQSITYALGKYSLGVGHSNSGSVLQSDGRSSNVKVYNGRSSVVYGNVSASF